MYGMEIDSIKLSLQRYRTAYLDAEEQKKNATDNYKQSLIWGVRANIERELGQKANEQAEKVHEAAAKIMRQVGSGARANGAGSCAMLDSAISTIWALPLSKKFEIGTCHHFSLCAIFRYGGFSKGTRT